MTEVDGTKSVPCGNLPTWDWKSGVPYTDKLSGPQIRRNYFDCGTYYFDGTFNVVKFPKGMTIYHGGGIIANAVIEFPLGIDYYKEFDMSNPKSSLPLIMDGQEVHPQSKEFVSAVATYDETIEEVVSKALPVSAGWYADPSVARIYSLQASNATIKANCQDKCVLAFKLKRDVVMYLLDDDQNIAKLLNTKWMDKTEKKRLLQMFHLDAKYLKTPPVRTMEDTPFTRLRYPNYDHSTKRGKQRVSSREWDLPFAKWMCEHVVTKMRYSGYAATSQYSVAHGGQFHQEFVFCNAAKYLQRDYGNILDWQHFNPGATKPILTYIRQLTYYQSYNVNFHAGDLLQHSIWTLLFSEYIMTHNNIVLPPAPYKDLAKLTAFTAFIHDIGKMSPKHTRANRTPIGLGFKYFSIPDHPTIGSAYVSGRKKLPVFDGDLKQVGVLSIDKLFKAFGINLRYKPLVAAVIDIHWDFGDTLRKLNSASNKDKAAVEYLGKFLKVFPVKRDAFLNGLYVALVVSMADIKGSQPYGVGRLAKPMKAGTRLNKASSIFPFLTNVPKKYRGGNVATISQVDTIGKRFADHIMTMAIKAPASTFPK